MSETTVQGNIVMDEQLNIAIDRVEKLDDPLLVIGLGGTGADILLTIKRMFAERFTLPRDESGNPIPIPRRTDYLAIDSSKATFMSFEPVSYTHLQGGQGICHSVGPHAAGDDRRGKRRA